MRAPRTPDNGVCVQMAEVEVDVETGQVFLKRFLTAQDVGTIINELGHQGQINGAVVQGIGYALMEELVLEDGRVITPNFADYKMPTIQDAPQLITVNVPDRGDALGPEEIRVLKTIIHAILQPAYVGVDVGEDVGRICRCCHIASALIFDLR